MTLVATDCGKRIGVFCLQMGGPTCEDDLDHYVERLFNDPYLIRLPRLIEYFRKPLAKWVSARRTPELRRQYARIGNCSPNNATTIRQAEALEKELAAHGDFRCFASMTYTSPRTEDAVASALGAGCTHFIALSLFPHFCGATTESSLNELMNALAAKGIKDDSILQVSRWGEHPLYLDAASHDIEQECRAALEIHGTQPHLLISAHGLPVSMVRRGDPYVHEIEATVRALIKRLPKGVEHTLSYQSRATPVAWVRPSTTEAIEQLAARGVKNIVVHPISFVNDHIETLVEIDIELFSLATSLGVERFTRIPTFNNDPRLILILKELVLKELAS